MPYRSTARCGWCRNLSGHPLWIGNATNFVLGGVKIPGIVRAYGWNPQVTVADGITVYAPGASVIRSFVNRAGEGNSGTLLLGNYLTSTAPGVNFPAYSFLDTAAPSNQRNPPAFVRYNLYNQYSPTSSLVTDETILRGSIDTYPGFPGVIGGDADYNGVLPPVPGAARAPMSGVVGISGGTLNLEHQMRPTGSILTRARMEMPMGMPLGREHRCVDPGRRFYPWRTDLRAARCAGDTDRVEHNCGRSYGDLSGECDVCFC